jgi:hypothetical protein
MLAEGHMEQLFLFGIRGASSQPLAKSSRTDHFYKGADIQADAVEVRTNRFPSSGRQLG